MATETYGAIETLPAAADLSAKQFYAVSINSSGQAALVAATGARVDGIVWNKPAAAVGSAVSVRVLDNRKAKAIAGGTIAAGDLLKSDSAGKLVVTTAAAVVNTSDAGAASDPVIGSYVVGVALASAVSGDIFPFLATNLGAVPTTAA